MRTDRQEIKVMKQRLQDQLDQQDAEHQAHRPKPNEKMEKETPDTLDKFPFWCTQCREDLDLPCYKTKHRFYGDHIYVWQHRVAG